MDLFSWICRCRRNLVKWKNAGWSNLFYHIKIQHSDYSSTSDLIFSALPAINAKGDTSFKWLIWISSLKPFSFNSDPMTRVHAKLEPISVNTVMKYMSLVTRRLEEKNSLCTRHFRHSLMAGPSSKLTSLQFLRPTPRSFTNQPYWAFLRYWAELAMPTRIIMDNFFGYYSCFITH